MARSVDLLVLAVPVDALAKLLPHVLSLVNEGTTVTDMGSTKEVICQAVRGHARRRQYVPSHPMSGTENSGPSAAYRGLFRGRTAVICNPEESAPEHVQRVEAMYQVLGMRLTRMGAEEHDLHVAFVSHLSHVTSFVLANTVLAEEKNANTIFDLAGGGFESTARLAKSSPSMWGPIFDQNRTNVVNAVDRYLEHLHAFREALVSTDTGEQRDLMEQANQIRRVLEQIGSRRKGSPVKQ
jgi:prephenate dehydrogenase